MKLSSLILKLSIATLIGFISCSAFAADEFFEVGKTYLFAPRMDLIMKGKVTQVTDQEVVFTERSILKASKAAAQVKNNDVKSREIKTAAIAQYLKSDKKESLLEANALKNIPISYSRSEMTAIKIED